MRPYEAMIVLSPRLDEEAIDAVLGRVQSVIADGGGEVVKLDKWGRRRLAYEIAGNTEGFYALVTFNAPAALPRELDRVLRITEDVIRHLVVRIGDEPLQKAAEGQPGQGAEAAGPAGAGAEAAGAAQAEAVQAATQTAAGEAAQAETPVS